MIIIGYNQMRWTNKHEKTFPAIRYKSCFLNFYPNFSVIQSDLKVMNQLTKIRMTILLLSIAELIQCE